MRYYDLVTETFINFIDPAVKYADSAKAWKFRRVGTLGDGLTILRTMIPNTHGAVQEFFVMDGRQPVATIFLAPHPKGMQVRYVAVTPSHRGRGIGRRLYKWLLTKGITLVSDAERSDEGTDVWRWLARQPSISVTTLSGDEITWDDPDALFVARLNP